MFKKRCFFYQYKCCGNKHCRLYGKCSKLPQFTMPTALNIRRNYEYVERKNEGEKKEHRKKFIMYNRIFGLSKEGNKSYE